MVGLGPRRSHPSLAVVTPDYPTLLLFFETYRGADGFRKHIQGPQFKNFVKQYGHCFIPADPLPDDPAANGVACMARQHKT
jgi:hypothetical protein